MEFKLGELFCGPGGLALGAHMASDSMEGMSIVHEWATDYDADTCETYRNNIDGATAESVIHADVRQYPLSTLPAIDGLAFGFPCNDFSVVGEKLGFQGEFGPLYTYGVHVLKSHRPQWFMAENVGGLASSNSGQEFRKILHDMRNAGYRVVPHLYKFERYGVPQARHRILIVGIREDLNDVTFHVPSPEPYESVDVSAQRALEFPPIQHGAYNHERTRQSTRVIERLQHIAPGQNAFTADLPEHLKLNVKSTTLSHIYKRLRPDRPSYTVTGSGGGGTHVYHWTEPRALTNRERARLQTFPDDYRFHGSKESVRKQVGMAVPPRGAAVVFEAILKSFAHEDYESVDPNIKLP